MVHALHASACRRVTAMAVALCSLSCRERAVEARDTALPYADSIGAGADGARSRSRGRIPYGFNGVPWVGQWTPPWGQLRYGDDPSCSTYREGGCGPTAFAMVLRYHGRAVNPDDVGSIAVASGVRRCPGGTDGTNADFLREVANHYGVDVTVISRDYQRVLDILRKRQPIIAVGHGRGYTARQRFRSYAAHFLVLTGVDVIRHRGQRRTVVRVNDPGNASSIGIAYMTISQFHRMHRFLHLTPGTHEQPAVAFAADPAPAATVRCDGPALRSWRRFAESDALTDDAWVAYGRSLAACEPRGRPWETIGAGDRERFLDEYIIPFVNGDAVRGSVFQRSEPKRYTDLVRAWKLEG